MVTGIGKYLTVYLVSMLKFIGGPTLGAAVGLSFAETVIITVMGMMTSVVIVSFFGPGLRKWLNNTFRKDQKVFSKRNRKMVTFWRRYGLFGISFLTPVLFSPIVGTLLVYAFGGSKIRIISYMLISAIFWSLTLSKALNILPLLFK
jgi:hypothetical protein